MTLSKVYYYRLNFTDQEKETLLKWKDKTAGHLVNVLKGEFPGLDFSIAYRYKSMFGVSSVNYGTLILPEEMAQEKTLESIQAAINNWFALQG